MLRPSRLLFTLPILLALGITGCGTTTSTSNTPSSTMPSSSQSTSNSTSATGVVASIVVNASAQVLQASSQPSSVHHEATFILTALMSNGQPAANQPVTFYIGPMKPLSGIPPKAWYLSGTSQSNPYIASASSMTNAKGQATVVLYGQPVNTMEMVGVKVGHLSSYDAKAMRSIAGLDAWWTSSGVKNAAPIGNTVTVNPWISTVSSSSSKHITVSVHSSTGAGTSEVTCIVKGASKSSSTGSMGSSSMSSGVTQMKSIEGNGSTTFDLSLPPAEHTVPVRIVVTNQSTGQRFAGGINAQVNVK